MIPRYEAKEISKLWTDEHKFTQFLKIEFALLSALEKHNKIPHGTRENFSHVKIDPNRILEIEAETRHDVIAFCTSITEQVEESHSKFFHYGVTSSDVIDSALFLQIKDSMEIEISCAKKLLAALKKRAIETKDWLTIGRSHGMFAEPMSFGQKFLSFYEELKRRIHDLEEIYNNDLTMQISGSVGNYTILDPQIEIEVAKEIGLSVEPLSTQIIPRDRIAKIVQANALLSVMIERFCIEVRHLHHSDISELAEGFKKGQKGSSIMPHKKNPISAENLSGLSRVIRSHAQLSLENTLLWHERDISHSSAERLMLPDHFGLVVYALKRLTDMVENLDLYRDKIEAKVLNNTQYLSSFYLHFLIEKIPNIKREDLYKVIQSASFDSTIKNPSEFANRISEGLKEINITITLPHLDANGLRGIYLRSIDDIYRRCL